MFVCACAQVLDVYVFNQGQVVYLLLYRVIVCTKLPKWHYLGLAIICGGGYAVLSGSSQVIGVIIAGGGGVAAVVFMELSTEVQATFSLMESQMIMQSVAMTCCIVLSVTLSYPGDTLYISLSDPFHPHYGILGWMSLPWPCRGRAVFTPPSLHARYT